ncbi:MAG: DUF4402 domain-containing protein [Alphaproteobacteria bacterium]
MPKRLCHFFLAALVALLALISRAEAQVSVTFPTSESSMAFGIVASDVDVAGAVVLSSTTQAVSATGGARTFGGTTAAPRFRIGRGNSGGNNATTYTITWPASFTVSNGAQTATVNTITCSIVASTAQNAFNCTSGGTVGLRRNEYVDIRLGGSLQLPANQARGNYAGTLTVTAN